MSDITDVLFVGLKSECRIPFITSTLRGLGFTWAQNDPVEHTPKGYTPVDGKTKTFTRDSDGRTVIFTTAGRLSYGYVNVRNAATFEGFSSSIKRKPDLLVYSGVVRGYEEEFFGTVGCNVDRTEDIERVAREHGLTPEQMIYFPSSDTYFARNQESPGQLG